jgi:hypothetical protein
MDATQHQVHTPNVVAGMIEYAAATTLCGWRRCTYYTDFANGQNHHKQTLRRLLKALLLVPPLATRSEKEFV